LITREQYAIIYVKKGGGRRCLPSEKYGFPKLNLASGKGLKCPVLVL